jgi:hypothetical protein
MSAELGPRSPILDLNSIGRRLFQVIRFHASDLLPSLRRS